jgi:anti-anti-sigma factor
VADAVLYTTTTAGQDGPVIRLTGEADITTKPILRGALDAAITSGARWVTLDAAGLAFLDSSCLHLVLEANRALRHKHGGLTVAGPQPVVARILEITGADQLLQVAAEALPAGAAPVAMPAA